MKFAIAFILVFLETNVIGLSLNNRYNTYDFHVPHRKQKSAVERILMEEPQSFYPVPPYNYGVFNPKVDPMEQMQIVTKGTVYPWSDWKPVNPMQYVQYQPRQPYSLDYMTYKNMLDRMQAYTKPTTIVDLLAYRKLMDQMVNKYNKPAPLPSGVDPFVDVFDKRKKVEQAKPTTTTKKPVATTKKP